MGVAGKSMARGPGHVSRVAVCCSLLITACSGEERLAPLASGGMVGTAGNSSGGSIGGAGGGGAAGGGAAGGSSASGAGGEESGGAAGRAGGGTGGVRPTQVFDPNRVYVQGRADDADCTTWIVGDPAKPKQYEGGFACENANLTLRPVDGALLYAQATRLKLWEPDYVATGFPPDPASNDIPVATPVGCSEGASRAWFQAESDRIYFKCDSRVLSPEGQLELASDSLLAVGKGGLLLTGDDTSLKLRSGAIVTRVESGALSLNDSNVAAVRAVPSGFLILLTPSGTKPEAAVSVTLDGAVTRLVDYPAAPIGVTAVTSCQLEPSAAAVCLVKLGTARGVARFDPAAGLSELLYQEQPNRVQLANARLFTGP